MGTEAIQACIGDLLEVLSRLQVAIAKAERALPQSVRDEHWRAARHEPNAWTAVYYAHIHDAAREIATGTLLVRDLVGMREKIKALLLDVDALIEQPAPNLSLKRQRKENGQ